ncbi:hypothetical protein B0T11DRAFT_67382 [Plectosphaerella cucumerina]|uniref:Fucose-specific lectin n=1 Tax=Plectosphaerella cucumerina TaxID=40658 RepID=A0A8K0TP38_9PEZI|nr:hypothetical protein B0T11DRAFT_67382 [Plectosphaerella cucumerina]
MAGNANWSGHPQPGLEVVQPEYYSAPEALSPNDPRDPKYNDSYYAPHALPPTHTGDPKNRYAYGVIPGAGGPPTTAYPGPETGELHADGSSPARSSKKKWWLIGGALLLLVIIGAVVGGLYGGGVIGSKKSQTTDGDDNDTNTTGPTTTDPAATASPTALSAPRFVRQGSPLTAAGWETPEGDTEIFLFHQDDTNGIYYSRFYDGTTALATLNGTHWTEPVEVSTAAKANTRLAATLIVYAGVFQPQVQVYYSGGEARMLGVNVNLRNDPPSGEDSINNSRLVAQPGSAVAAYWPWMTYQSAAGELMEVRNRLQGAFAPSSTWDVRGLGITTDGGSGVAMVPMSAIFRSMAVEGGFGLIYRNSGGVLAVAVPRLDDGEVADGYARSWPSDNADFPSISVELDAPIAAFSVARPNDSAGRVDTFILYLDGTDIHMVYTTGESWEQSSPAALRDVDKDADIACITLGSSNSGSDGKTQRIPLAGRNSKCYFQRGGVVQEVVLDGTDWKKAEAVPIP